jgi:hypothetical protein
VYIGEQKNNETMAIFMEFLKLSKIFAKGSCDFSIRRHGDLAVLFNSRYGSEDLFQCSGYWSLDLLRKHFRSIGSIEYGASILAKRSVLANVCLFLAARGNLTQALP